MNNEKYYTPSLEEFHVGFEYETLQDERMPENDSSWEKSALDDTRNFEEFLLYWRNDSFAGIRVKCLDKSDCEALGWEELGSAWYSLRDVPGKLGYYLYVHMRMFQGDVLIKAYRYDPKTCDTKVQEEVTLFDGRLKNKSALRRVMQQIKIL